MTATPDTGTRQNPNPRLRNERMPHEQPHQGTGRGTRQLGLREHFPAWMNHRVFGLKGMYRVPLKKRGVSKGSLERVLF